MTGANSVLSGTALNVVVTIAGTVGAALLVWAVRGVLRGCRRFSQFLDDWFGQPARPGVNQVPGFPQRMQQIEHAVFGTNAVVQYELTRNGGGSAKDQLDRIDEATKAS